MLRSLGSWAAAGFLLAACVSPLVEASPTAWVEVVAEDPEGEAFRPVVEDAVRYRLEALGLAVRLHGSLQGSARSGRSPSPSAPFLESAGRAGAEFALECRYAGSGSRLSLLLNWYELPARLMTAAVDRKGRVDLELDTLILDALEELLNRVKGRVEERVVAARAGEGAAGTTAGTAAPVGGAGGAGEASVAASGGEPGPAASGPTESASPEEPRPETGSPAAGPDTEPPAVEALPGTGTSPGVQPPPPAARYQGARLLLSPSLAPFIAVGAASYYFPIGYQSVLQIGLLPRKVGGRLALGLLLGVTGFQAQGVTETSLNFLVPAGLLLRYGLELGRNWGLLFHLGAGMALLVMDTKSQGILTKPLPFVRNGVGVELALGRKASLGLEAAYEVYFEVPYLIMGFAPGLSFSLRL